MSATVALELWSSGDLSMLERLMREPRMTEHLGGPESSDELRERQGRCERLEGGDRMFEIVDVVHRTATKAPSVAYQLERNPDLRVHSVTVHPKRIP